MYKLDFAPEALIDVEKLQKSEPAAFKKLEKLLKELREHPRTGTGHPKPLGNNRAGQWSRKITEKHRLVYVIKEGEEDKEEGTILLAMVNILSSYGHYDDK